MLYPAAKSGDNILGLDLHDVMGATPSPGGPVPTPVPKWPHPFTGTLSVWHSPKWPVANVFVNGMPAATVGCKSYGAHVPPILPPPVVFTSWLPPNQISMKWYIPNLMTAGIGAAFETMLGVVKALVDKDTRGRGEQVPDDWQTHQQEASGISWGQIFQTLLPPAVLPIAEGNASIGSPTVTVNGAPFALVGPLFASSCTTNPASLVPNASVVGFSNVMVGLSLSDFLLQVFGGAVDGIVEHLEGKVFDKIKCFFGLDPIDLVSGCNFEDQTDFVLPGPLPLTWSRAYRSLKTGDGPLGCGWRYELGRWLEAATDGFDYVTEEGMRYHMPFLHQNGDTYLHPSAFFVVTRESEVVYQLRARDNRLYTFEWPPLSSRAYLTSIADLNGNRIRLSYDKKRMLIRIIDSANRTIHVDSDAAGRITTVRLAGDGKRTQDLRLVNYGYDLHGNLITVTDAAGKASCYGYDDHHRMIQKTDRNGYSVFYEYNSVGQCTKSWGQDGSYGGEIEYHPSAGTRILTVPNGSRHLYRHNEQNLVTAIIDAYGGVHNREYNAAGNLVTEIDPNSSVRRLEYDERGNVLEETDFEGRIWERKWNELNQLVEETDPSGAVHKWTYDERGNLLEETDEFDVVIRHAYNERGQQIRTELPDDTREFEYLPDGMLRRIAGASGELERFVYDRCGNVVAHWVSGVPVNVTVDALGRVRERRYADGRFEQLDYDAESNLILRRDVDGAVWRFKYGAVGRLVQEIDPLGNTTHLAHTKSDDLTQVTDPNANVHGFAYDLNDELKTVSRNGVLIEQQLRDRGGRVVEVQDGQGVSLVRYKYGKGEQIDEMAVARAETVVRRYDEAGRVNFAQTDSVTREFKYDELDRVVRELCNGDEITHEFDADGYYKSTVCSDAGACSFAGNDGGSETNIEDPCGGTHVLDEGRLVRRHQLPNGLIEWRFLDGAGLLRRVAVQQPGEGPVQILFDQSCDYDEFGKIISRSTESVASPPRHESFHYDLMDRLVRATDSHGPNLACRYDSAGNLLLHENTETGPDNRVTRSGAVEYDHDGRGNLTRKRSPDDSLQFEYDGFDRLIGARNDRNGQHARYGYDSGETRAWKEVDGRRTWFQYRDHQLIREVFGQDRRRVYFYFNPDETTPTMFVDLERGDDDSWKKTPYHVHQDGNGVPAAVSDSAGKIVWQLHLSPYGEAEVWDPHSLNFELRYPGQYFDAESGLCYNGYRMYDPQIGRFTTPDPIGLQGGPNLYAYPANPLTEVDVLGMAKASQSKSGCPKRIGDLFKKGKAKTRQKGSSSKKTGSADKKSRNAKAQRRGGAYGSLDNPQGQKKIGKGTWAVERNHTPAYGAVKSGKPPLSRGRAPAMEMDRADHRAMKSTGSSKQAKKYRAEQKKLIKEGKFEEAFEKDVQNIRGLENNGVIQPKGKYDKGIEETRQYVEQLRDQGQLPPRQ